MKPTGGPCPDCAVAPGVAHEDGCDVARCLATGDQRIQCGGQLHEFKGRSYGEHEGECRFDVWTGDWPGDVECHEYGFWCYWGSGPGGQRSGWIPCGPDHPDAREDLNRLVIECVWDREQHRYVRRTV